MAAENPRDMVEYQSDHDVLIELRTEMRGVRSDISEMKTDTVARLVFLEKDHVARKEIESLNLEIISLKLWRSMLAGAWLVCTVILIPLAFAIFT